MALICSDNVGLFFARKQAIKLTHSPQSLSPNLDIQDTSSRLFLMEFATPPDCALCDCTVYTSTCIQYSAVWVVTPTQPQCAAPCFLFQLMRTYRSAQFAPSSGTEAAQLARVWHPRRYYTISPAIECLQRETLAWREDRIWLMTRPNPHKYAVSFFFYLKRMLFMFPASLINLISGWAMWF